MWWCAEDVMQMITRTWCHEDDNAQGIACRWLFVEDYQQMIACGRGHAEDAMKMMTRRQWHADDESQTMTWRLRRWCFTFDSCTMMRVWWFADYNLQSIAQFCCYYLMPFSDLSLLCLDFIVSVPKKINFTFIAMYKAHIMARSVCNANS